MGPTHARLAYEIETTCERGYTTMSSPPALVWASWPSTDTSSQGASACGVVFGPRPALQIWNFGREATCLDAVTAGGEVVLDEMNLGLDEGEFITEVAEAVVEASVALDLSGRVPVVEIGNGAAKGVEGGCWPVE
jgi:hypothetical protein